MYCFTALFPACGFGYAQIVKTLIGKGADVNHQTHVGILHVCPHAPVQWQCFFRVVSGILCSLHSLAILYILMSLSHLACNKESEKAAIE